MSVKTVTKPKKVTKETSSPDFSFDVKRLATICITFPSGAVEEFTEEMAEDLYDLLGEALS